MARQRFTITLSTEILKRLDALVDGERIRNRSHAAEVILSQSLRSQRPKVLILAGGKGFKSGLLQVQGKPLLQHTLENLSSQGFSDIVISSSREGLNQFKKKFGDGSSLGIKVSYVMQGNFKPSTAQPVKQVEQLFTSGHFIVIYGDVLSDINYSDLVEFHRGQKNNVATMALTSVEHVSMWGVARLVGSRIFDLEEKPKTPRSHSHLVNAGIYVFEPSIFKYIGDRTIKLEKEVFPRLAEEGRLVGYSFAGRWQDVSSMQTEKAHDVRL